MRDQFEQFLIRKGYSKETPSGHPSTVYDYLKRIDSVCKEEHYSWGQLAASIDSIVRQYDVGGKKQDIGEKSHRAVINALKQFQEFVNIHP